ncbi:3-hydroxyacyl-CoA dehydrogenase NAD-binding domain-containing protein [Pseudomonadota bacterium]
MSKHWRREKDDDGIIWLHFDHADSGTNVLSDETLEELSDQLVKIEQAHPIGLVILSDKANGFIAGADIKGFTRVKDTKEAHSIIRRAHAIFKRLEGFSFPTLALIHGFCLGGGLELALACRYRVAREDEGTRIGLPEVKLGLFPGFGGSVRSMNLIGHLPALNMMLTGRSFSGSAARRLGLVDMAVPERHLLTAARHMILERPEPHRPTWQQKFPGGAPFRPLVAAYLKREVGKKARQDHYPAPYALIDHWERYADRPDDMYASEAEKVAELICSETAQNLIRVFFLQEQLKSQGRKSDIAPKHVHVVGGGVMGGDIAAWCALKGFTVTLQDRGPEFLNRAMGRAYSLFKKKLKKPHLVQAAADRLIPDVGGTGVPKADVIIEAIFENVEAKQALYKDLEPRIKKDALLCTNTSSIPLELLNVALKNPKRLVGLHFFNPVAKMQLIEIVSAKNTDKKEAKRAAAFARHIDRLPLPVRSSPGFLVNRILMPYLLEAVQLLDEQVPASFIDNAAMAFGMPMGPIELADTVGLDICLAVADKLAEDIPVQVPERLREMVQKGSLGRKSGQGFYRYAKGKKQKPTQSQGYVPPRDLTDRLILRMLNEAVACLREGVVESADMLDAGVIFGTGFAPFRGGPMHYVENRGLDDIRQQLEKMEQSQGGRFVADKGWETLFTS